MSQKKCGGCEHFERFAGDNKGYCYGLPPTMFVSGGQSIPPQVKESRKACSLFTAIPEGQVQAVKIKSKPETPGDAAKAARANR